MNDTTPASYLERLRAALSALDREETATICAELIRDARRGERLPDSAELTAFLGSLRRKRQFSLLESVGDALLLRDGMTSWMRCIYVQSLLDQGKVAAAIRELRALDGSADMDPVTRAEVRGLLGRAHKQLYVDSGGRDQASLRAAIEYYTGEYELDPTKLWHGINVVALTLRAAERAPRWKDPRAIATAIRAAIESRWNAQRIDPWDLATALEASIALGDASGATLWAARYAESAVRGGSRADAFELASTIRQLCEVWQLDAKTGIGAIVLPMLEARLLEASGGALRIDRVAQRLAQLPESAWRASGAPLYVSLENYRRGLECAAAVAKIVDARGKGFGTGFVVRGASLFEPWGDELVLVTNAHVIDDRSGKYWEAVPPRAASACFESEGSQLALSEVLWRSPVGVLDTSIVRFGAGKPRVAALEATDELPDRTAGDLVYVIGHPLGGPLTFSIHHSRLIDHDGTVLHYRTPTEPGSSGSAVFDRSWRVIGVHHAGRRGARKLHGAIGTYDVNEGQSWRAIRAAIRAELSRGALRPRGG